MALRLSVLIRGLLKMALSDFREITKVVLDMKKNNTSHMDLDTGITIKLSLVQSSNVLFGENRY